MSGRRRPGRVHAAGATSTRGWARAKPKTKADRRALKQRCGAKAFLQPSKLKYPIMAKSGGCVVDCRALRAAKSRAGQRHHRKLEAKADRRARAARCAWAR
jgi:hypothetical protein